MDRTRRAEYLNKGNMMIEYAANEVVRATRIDRIQPRIQIPSLQVYDHDQPLVSSAVSTPTTPIHTPTTSITNTHPTYNDIIPTYTLNNNPRLPRPSYGHHLPFTLVQIPDFLLPTYALDRPSGSMGPRREARDGFVRDSVQGVSSLDPAPLSRSHPHNT